MGEEKGGDWGGRTQHVGEESCLIGRWGDGVLILYKDKGRNTRRKGPKGGMVEVEEMVSACLWASC